MRKKEVTKEGLIVTVMGFGQYQNLQSSDAAQQLML